MLIFYILPLLKASTITSFIDCSTNGLTSRTSTTCSWHNGVYLATLTNSAKGIIEFERVHTNRSTDSVSGFQFIFKNAGNVRLTSSPVTLDSPDFFYFTKTGKVLTSPQNPVVVRGGDIFSLFETKTSGNYEIWSFTLQSYVMFTDSDPIYGKNDFIAWFDRDSSVNPLYNNLPDRLFSFTGQVNGVILNKFSSTITFQTINNNIIHMLSADRSSGIASIRGPNEAIFFNDYLDTTTAGSGGTLRINPDFYCEENCEYVQTYTDPGLDTGRYFLKFLESPTGAGAKIKANIQMQFRFVTCPVVVDCPNNNAGIFIGPGLYDCTTQVFTNNIALFADDVIDNRDNLNFVMEIILPGGTASADSDCQTNINPRFSGTSSSILDDFACSATEAVSVSDVRCDFGNFNVITSLGDEYLISSTYGANSNYRYLIFRHGGVFIDVVNPLINETSRAYFYFTSSNFKMTDRVNQIPPYVSSGDILVVLPHNESNLPENWSMRYASTNDVDISSTFGDGNNLKCIDMSNNDDMNCPISSTIFPNDIGREDLLFDSSTETSAILQFKYPGRLFFESIGSSTSSGDSSTNVLMNFPPVFDTRVGLSHLTTTTTPAPNSTTTETSTTMTTVTSTATSTMTSTATTTGTILTTTTTIPLTTTTNLTTTTPTPFQYFLETRIGANHIVPLVYKGLFEVMYIPDFHCIENCARFMVNLQTAVDNGPDVYSLFIAPSASTSGKLECVVPCTIGVTSANGTFELRNVDTNALIHTLPGEALTGNSIYLVAGTVLLATSTSATLTGTIERQNVTLTIAPPPTTTTTASTSTTTTTTTIAPSISLAIPFAVRGYFGSFRLLNVLSSSRLSSAFAKLSELTWTYIALPYFTDGDRSIIDTCIYEYINSGDTLTSTTPAQSGRCLYEIVTFLCVEGFGKSKVTTNGTTVEKNVPCSETYNVLSKKLDLAAEGSLYFSSLSSLPRRALQIGLTDDGVISTVNNFYIVTAIRNLDLNTTSQNAPDKYLITRNKEQLQAPFAENLDALPGNSIIFIEDSFLNEVDGSLVITQTTVPAFSAPGSSIFAVVMFIFFFLM